VAKSLQQTRQRAQDRRYGTPEDIQRRLDLGRGFDSRFGSEPSFFERMRQQEDEIHGITPKLPDYTKPVDPAPVPSFKKDQFLLASNGDSSRDNIMEQVAELATLSQKINIILNSPNTSEAEKSQFRNILNNLQNRMNQLLGQERNRRPGGGYGPDQPKRNYGLLV